MTCALNPMLEFGRENVFESAERKKRVFVVGGGVGGMETARVCALRGHDVTLFEKGSALGGVFVPAASLPCKEADRRLLRWYQNEIASLGVKVKINVEVTLPLIQDECPDVVVVCTGAKKRKLNIPGGESVMDALDYLQRQDFLEKSLLVIGGGLSGCEIAYEAARQGKRVTILEALDDILTVKGLCWSNSNMLRDLLALYEVEVITSAIVEKIDGNKIYYRKNDETAFVEADLAVRATGYDADTALYDELVKEGVDTRIVGDAKAAGNLMTVIRDAYDVAFAL